MPLVDIADPRCALPDTLIVDANVLLNMVDSSNPRRMKILRDFLNRVGIEVRARRLNFFVPILALEECYFKLIERHYNYQLPAHQTRLRATLRKQNVRWHDLYKDSPHLIRDCLPIVNTFRMAVFNIPVTPIEPEDLANFVPQFPIEARLLHHMGAVPILPKDAYHLAVAERLQVPYIVTLDRDFQRDTRLTIYTIL